MFEPPPPPSARPTAVCKTPAPPAPPRLGRLCQARLRRTHAGVALSRPLHPSRGHFQSSLVGLRPGARPLSLEGLCPRWQARQDDSWHHRVLTTLLSARAPQRLRAHPSLRIPRPSLSRLPLGTIPTTLAAFPPRFAALPKPRSDPRCRSTPIAHRARRQRQRLPPSLLIENASVRDPAPPQQSAPRRFRSRLATIRELAARLNYNQTYCRRGPLYTVRPGAGVHRGRFWTCASNAFALNSGKLSLSRKSWCLTTSVRATVTCAE